jgi:hypothetical protein
MFSKNPIYRNQREEYAEEEDEGKTWMYVLMIFSFSDFKYSEKMINTFRCSKIIIYIYTEGFHKEKKNRCRRTPVNIATLSVEQHQEASRGTAAEQTSSPLRSEFNTLLKYPFLPESRICDPVTLGNLVSIGNNQWNQVGHDS